MCSSDPKNPNPELGQLVNVKEVARKLAISTRTVWKLVASGDLPPPLKIGGARRWHQADIQAFVERLFAERNKH